MKKSGLADSPFFRPSPTEPVIAADVLQSSVNPPASVATEVFSQSESQLIERSDEQPHNRSDTQIHNRTVAQPHKGTIVQSHKSTDAQLHNRAGVQTLNPSHLSQRKMTRESYDIYEDQADAVERLRLRWKREQRRHITKGEVMRTLLEEILAAKQ